MEARIVSAGEARALCPLPAGDAILAGAFSPHDGHATPEAVVQGYAFGARAHGAVLRVGWEVTGIDVRAGEISGPEGQMRDRDRLQPHLG